MDRRGQVRPYNNHEEKADCFDFRELPVSLTEIGTKFEFEQTDRKFPLFVVYNPSREITNNRILINDFVFHTAGQIIREYEKQGDITKAWRDLTKGDFLWDMDTRVKKYNP